MRKEMLFVAALMSAGSMNAVTVVADGEDTLHIEQMQEVVVKGVKAQKDAPFAIANVAGKDLQSFSKTGREPPFLFSQTPGVVAWSENGLGTGTTYMRIRGAAGSRVNVTLDGVPMNSPEDQCVFWANMNSYGSLLGGVQIQRGVGTSTNGDGAGGTVALMSKSPSEIPSLELSTSYGSYNTYNIGGSFSTGLLWNHLIFDGAYHETNTDGYIHGTAGRSGSYYGGLAWIDDKFVIRYKNFGNFEKTGQAWNGVTAGNDDQSIMDGTYGENTGIKTYKDMYNAGLGRFNSLYERFVFGESGYATERYRLKDGSLWEQATDNFWQNHNILSLAWQINDNWSTSASLHYTHGYGYYNEFRYNNKLSKFGFENFIDSEGNTVKRTDFIRKKGLEQDAYGLVWNANYKADKWDVIGGVSLQQFACDHFGYVTYIANDELSDKYLAKGDYKYYDSTADKGDYSVYVKAAYAVTPELSVFADAQYRHVTYKTDGINDKFYETDDGMYVNHVLDIDKKYDFFNPKAGVSYSRNGHRAYASAAWSHREPERNNFTDNGSYPAPKAEQLFDYEAGYTYTSAKWHAGVNLYYMDYKDQFVQTGAVSDIGEALTTNISKSYRMGVEITAGADVTQWLTLEGNAALSKNKIKDFDEVVEDWDNGSQTIHYGNSTLAFSPETILNGFARFHVKGFEAVWHTNFVGRQYLDNTENTDRSLPCYSVSNLHLGYTATGIKKTFGLKEVVLGLDFNNIFARRYASNGWVYSAICESAGHPNDNRYYQIGFIPMAGFTAMGSITLKF